MSAKVTVRISRIMPQNVYTRPPFYSWEKFWRIYTSTDAKWLRVGPKPQKCNVSNHGIALIMTLFLYKNEDQLNCHRFVS